MSPPKKDWAQIVLSLVLILSLFSPATNIEAPDRVHSSITSSEPDYWPTDRWRNSTPNEHGMSAQILNDMMDRIENQDYPIDSVFIVKDGYVVLEEYPGEYTYNYTLKNLHSVSKSIVSILLGVALQQDMLDNLSQQILDFFPEYAYLDPDPGWYNITIEHLLTMTPGFEWDEWSYPYTYPGNNPIMNMMYSADAVEYVLNRSMVYEPGEHWEYNGGASVLVGAIIQKAYGVPLYSVFRDHLFNRIGIDYFNVHSLPGGWYNVMGGVGLRPTDMARLGFLYLHNGTWNETQIVSADYVANSIQPIEHQDRMGPSFDYGWHWWLRHDLGIYFAYGRYGQKIMISEEHNMIVVFTARVPDDGYDPEFDLYRDYILRSIAGDSPIGMSPEVLIGIAILVVAAVPLAVVVMKRARKN